MKTYKIKPFDWGEYDNSMWFAGGYFEIAPVSIKPSNSKFYASFKFEDMLEVKFKVFNTKGEAKAWLEEIAIKRILEDLEEA